MMSILTKKVPNQRIIFYIINKNIYLYNESIHGKPYKQSTRKAKTKCSMNALHNEKRG